MKWDTLFDNMWLWKNFFCKNDQYRILDVVRIAGMPAKWNYAFITYGNPESGKMEMILRRNGVFQLWIQK